MTETLRISDVINELDSVFPLSSQDSWDNSGLIIGNADWTVKGILFTVDINEQRIDEAIEKGCNLILAHHPILFHGIKRINGTSDEQRTIIKAIQNNIALCAFHTPADKSSIGLSRQIGKQINLQQMKTLIADCNSESGYGVIGQLQQPLTSSEFLQLVAEQLNCPSIRYNECNKQISKVAICTGSGSEFINDALQQNADAYITGDVKYHQFQQPEGKMLIADVGHYESEEISKKLFLDILTEKFANRKINFSNFALCISTTCSNVIKYYTR